MNIKQCFNAFCRRAGLALAGLDDPAEDIDRLQKDIAGLNGLVQAAAQQEGREFERQLCARLVELVDNRNKALDMLRGNVRDVIIHEAHIEKGHADFWLEHPLFWLFSLSVAEVWRVTGAVNYLECKLFAEDTGYFTITLQRQGMKTPHELRLEAEAERDAIKEELAQVGGLLEEAASIVSFYADEHPIEIHKASGMPYDPNDAHALLQQIYAVWDKQKQEPAQ